MKTSISAHINIRIVVIRISTGIGASILLALVLELVVVLIKKGQILSFVYSRYSMNK